MELINLQCPQCMGRIIPFGDGSQGKCESCDSVFKLGEPTRAATDVDGDEEDAEEEEFDLEGFIDDFAEGLNGNASYEFLVGTDLEGPAGEAKIAAATKYFEIDDDEEIFLILDTTLFKSCKVGFALCSYGIYMKDEDGDTGFLNWEDFADCDIEREGGKLYIGGSPFIGVDSEMDLLYPMLRRLQREVY